MKLSNFYNAKTIAKLVERTVTADVHPHYVRIDSVEYDMNEECPSVEILGQFGYYNTDGETVYAYHDFRITLYKDDFRRGDAAGIVKQVVREKYLD